MIASGIVPRVIAGSTRCSTASQAAGRSPVMIPSSTKNPVGWAVVMVTSWRPWLGRMPSLTANTSVSREPSADTGIATPSSEPTVDRLSTPLPGLRPATKPGGTPTSTANSMADVASSIVAGNLRPISSDTGRCVMIDVPRSPCAILPT